jgi:hypothetical protein
MILKTEATTLEAKAKASRCLEPRPVLEDYITEFYAC